jgi:2-dehydropantoate 2-reductase
MKFLILGAGAIGGYVGGRLTEAGRDVTFLLRDARREQLERDGLRIESTYGDFAGPVKTISQAELTPDYDLILLTCKAYDLDDALAAIAPGIGSETMVFPILNGLGHIAIMNDRLGAEHVLAGTVKISAARQADGTIKHMNDWRWLNFGEQAGGISDRVSALRDALDGATGLEPVALENAMQEMWEKMVHLATAAGMTTLMRANVGQIVRTKEGASLFQHFLATTAEVAKRSGHPPSDAFMANYRALFADPESKYATSMLRDIEAGNRSEGEHILGMLLTTAREVGIDEPLLATAYAGVKAYEARQNDGGL